MYKGVTLLMQCKVFGSRIGFAVAAQRSLREVKP
jgi:hypothetical protein